MKMGFGTKIITFIRVIISTAGGIVSSSFYLHSAELKKVSKNVLKLFFDIKFISLWRIHLVVSIVYLAVYFVSFYYRLHNSICRVAGYESL